MKQQTQDPIVLTGYTYTIGALADIFQQRELVAGRAKTGDMKLWCQRGERVWTGQFRAAVFDGKVWRTFRLNIVAEGDAHYDSLDNRMDKARRVFAALKQLKDQTARLRDGSYGCTFTLKAPAAHATVATPASASGRETTGGDTTAAQPTVAPQAAARTAQAPALATGMKSSVQVTGRKRKRKGPNPDQLTLF